MVPNFGIGRWRALSQGLPSLGPNVHKAAKRQAHQNGPAASMLRDLRFCGEPLRGAGAVARIPNFVISRWRAWFRDPPIVGLCGPGTRGLSTEDVPKVAPNLNGPNTCIFSGARAATYGILRMDIEAPRQMSRPLPRVHG